MTTVDAFSTREMQPDGTDPVPSGSSEEKQARIDDDAEIARLAALPLLGYEREREPAAKRLCLRVAILDRLVEAERRRGSGGAVHGQGQRLELLEPEPWPEPVNGGMLLDDIVTEIQRYVVIGEAEIAAIALWVVSVHAFDRFFIFPRLFITAPEKGCGKTTLLDAIERLVPRPLTASSITAAAFFRTIEAARPTLLLDEADTYMHNSEHLRGVLDAGHRRGGGVIRTVGDNHEPAQFSAWTPVVLAAIGRLPGTIEDRSIKIAMRRRRADEPLAVLRLDQQGKLEELARKAARSARDQGEALGSADPAMPTGIYNRTADNWRPMLAVADLAGGRWPSHARNAAVELSSRDGEDAASAGVLLLTDLRELFDRESSGVLFTKQIIGALQRDETRPWPEWKNGKPITDRQLAALLKRYQIKPKSVRRGDHTEKGYKLEWFEDAFVRYLPPRSVTASQPSVSAGLQPPRSVTPTIAVPLDVTDEGCKNASIAAGCDGVTDQEPTSLDEEAVWTG
jgi:putative DNA primase/helicase